MKMFRFILLPLLAVAFINTNALANDDAWEDGGSYSEEFDKKDASLESDFEPPKEVQNPKKVVKKSKKKKRGKKFAMKKKKKKKKKKKTKKNI